MKKLLPAILLLVTVVISACNLKEAINPDGSIKTTTNTGVTVGTGSSPNTYQPVTKGSTWTYTYLFANAPSFSYHIAMTGATSTFNNKTYYAASSDNPQGDGSLGYFYAGDHAYSTRSSNITAGVTVDMLYLNDSFAVGDSVITPVNDAGQINGAAGRFITKTIEKGISKTVNGKAYSNVIHTRVDLQYNYGLGFQSFGLYDYYLAKGIGMIELDFSSFGFNISTEVLSGYTIK